MDIDRDGFTQYIKRGRGSFGRLEGLDFLAGSMEIKFDGYRVQVHLRVL